MITLNLYRDKNRQFRWRVRASNGEVMANGAGDGYQRRRDLEKAIRRVLGLGENGRTIGQEIEWNRPDMRLEDETIISTIQPILLDKSEARKPRSSAPKPKRVRPPRKRTPEQKEARRLAAAKKRRAAKRKR